MHALLTAVVALAGVATLCFVTEGGRAFTAEGARRLAIERSPRPLPEAVLEDAAGRRLSTRDLHGKTLVVGFIYTHCGTVCPQQSRELAAVQSALADVPGGDRVGLLSVSFDPARDTPERLTEYARHFTADRARWRFARIVEPAELARWLEVFGIVVIPDGLGGFEHNAALHVVSAAGRLVAIHDLEDVAGVIARIASTSRDDV
jgi:protein SCO1/2